MGPRHRCRGNVVAPVILNSPRRHFNGATASLPWKRYCAWNSQLTAKALHWGHAITAVETIFVRGTALSFFLLQWGHGIAAVETRQVARRFVPSGELQWGHGIAAVETRRRRVDKSFAFGTSMGPRHRCRGNQR